MNAFSLELHGAPRWYACEAGWNWQPPPLPDFDLWYVARGRGHMTIGAHSWPLEAGRCFVLPRASRPQATQHEDERLLVFAGHFEGAVQSTLMAEVWDKLCPGGVLVRDRTQFENMGNRAETCWARNDELGRHQSALWLQQMLLLLCEEQLAPRRLDEEIQAVLIAMRREPARWWTLQELAAEAHLSRSQFARRFRAATQRAPNEWAMEMRLERARQLLQETDMTASQIARALGYNDLGFFSRQFKKRFGQSPRHLRRDSLGEVVRD